MTALTSPMSHRLRWTFADGLVLVGRKLTQVRHNPAELAATLIFPAVMVMLFGYVFGSAIKVPDGGNYREYLMPGLFSMVTFSAVAGVMVRVASDASLGVMDRFRSMPMAPLAVPLGQTGADYVTGQLSLAIMVGAGLLVGWLPHRGLVHTALAFLLIIVLRYALSWIGVYVGLVVKDDHVADAIVPLFLPFTMLSNAFVPTGGMPDWLRYVAEWNPVSALTAASRELFGNPGASTSNVAWPLVHPVTTTLLWSAALLAIFVPLSLRAYRRKGR